MKDTHTHTPFYGEIIHSAVVSHCLVHWTGEDSVTAVGRQYVLAERVNVDDEHNVKWGIQCYKASIAAVGEFVHGDMGMCTHVATCYCQRRAYIHRMWVFCAAV